MTSYFDYVPGSATERYCHAVDEAASLAEEQKRKVDPIHHERIDRLLDTYARRLAENINQSNAITARVPSILISGGGNFPVRQKEKQNRAADANMAEWRQIQGLLDKIRGAGTAGISADDPEAVQKLQAKLKGLEQVQEKMKAVNAYYRKNKTLDGCPQLFAEEIEKLKASMSRSRQTAPKPYESYLLTNNSAVIRQTKTRIAELARRSETYYQSWTFEGGAVKMDKAANRLRVFFDEKPDRETCSAMRHSGFKWAPSVGAWQRQLNDNAIRAAKHLDFLQPVEQPQVETDHDSGPGWGMSAADILHVRQGRNYLVDDFTRMERLRDDPEAMAILSRVAQEIGFDHICPYERVDGSWKRLPEITFAEWGNPYFALVPEKRPQPQKAQQTPER